MNNLNKIIILLLLIIPHTLFAQVSISGKIVDQDNKPVEFGEVYLVRDSLNGKFCLSDNLGEFSFNNENGNYSLNIRYFGKTIYSRDIVVKGDVNLGIIKTNTINSLGEISIVGHKSLIENKVDRMVFIAENFIGAQGGDAIDILNATPGIMVSNDKISIIGKSSMSVMINDRIIKLYGIDLQNFLKTIRSEDIKKIEVITNPPAKYEAEGNAGLINIVLKRAQNDTWSSSVQSSHTQGDYGNTSLGGSINLNKKDFSMFFNTSYSFGESAGEEESEIFYPKTTWKSKSDDVYSTNILGMRIGGDYNINKNFLLGVQYVGNYNRPDLEDNNKTIINNSLNKHAYINTSGESENKKTLNTLNIHSVIKLDTLGRKINIDADYLTYNTNNNRDYISTVYNSELMEFSNNIESANNTINREIKIYSAQIDIEHPINSFSLYYGGKVSHTNTNNDVKYFDTTSDKAIIDNNRSNEFNYKESTQALYITAHKKFFNQKWECKLGLRGENTMTEGYSNTLNSSKTKSYFELFPTAYLLFRPSEAHSLSINYGRRIYRPGFNEVNPFRFYSSPYAYSEGNPNLKPSFSSNIELNYSFKRNYQTSLYYSKTKDNSGQIALLEKDNYTQSVVRMNYFDSYAIGLKQVCFYRGISWLTSVWLIDGFYLKSTSKVYPITQKSLSTFSTLFKTINHFALNKQHTLNSGFDFMYILPMESADLVYNYEKLNLNIFVNMLFLNKDLRVTLTGNNLLKEYSFNTRSERNGIKAYYSGYYDRQNFRLSISYRFGSKKVKERQLRNGSNSEEQNRTN